MADYVICVFPVHLVLLVLVYSSGVPRNFFGGGGVNKFSSGQRTERTGFWGR